VQPLGRAARPATRQDLRVKPRGQGSRSGPGSLGTGLETRHRRRTRMREPAGCNRPRPRPFGSEVLRGKSAGAEARITPPRAAGPVGPAGHTAWPCQATATQRSLKGPAARTPPSPPARGPRGGSAWTGFIEGGGYQIKQHTHTAFPEAAKRLSGTHPPGFSAVEAAEMCRDGSRIWASPIPGKQGTGEAQAPHPPNAKRAAP